MSDKPSEMVERMMKDEKVLADLDEVIEEALRAFEKTRKFAIKQALRAEKEERK